MSRWKLLLSVFLALGLGLWIFGPILFQSSEDPGKKLVGTALPSGEIFTDSETKVKVDSLVAGPKNIISFWAEWCAPCVDEMPRINENKEALRAAGINLILVNIDQGIPEKIYRNMEAWLASQKLPLKTFYDFNSNYMDALSLPGLPAHVGFDGDKKIRWVALGQIDWELARIEKRF